MRTIKFRAWNKDEKKMYYNVEKTYDHMSPSNVPEDCFGDVLKNYINEWEVMQYLGLQDINGKEIYEGDIVLHKGEPLIVKYFEKYARFALGRNTEENKLPMIMTLIYNTEVIGNIYENPELLDGMYLYKAMNNEKEEAKNG